MPSCRNRCMTSYSEAAHGIMPTLHDDVARACTWAGDCTVAQVRLSEAKITANKLHQSQACGVRTATNSQTYTHTTHSLTHAQDTRSLAHLLTHTYMFQPPLPPPPPSPSSATHTVRSRTQARTPPARNERTSETGAQAHAIVREHVLRTSGRAQVLVTDNGRAVVENNQVGGAHHRTGGQQCVRHAPMRLLVHWRLACNVRIGHVRTTRGMQRAVSHWDR